MHDVPKFFNMEIQENTLLIEITATLEQIQRANQMITYHQQFKEPEANSIDNFLELRKDFLAQLNELLKGLNLEVRLRDAT